MTNIADPNWFAPRIRRLFDAAFSSLAGTPVAYLEIGVCAGFSLLWMAENVLTHPQSRAVGIDWWDLDPEPNARGQACRWEKMARKRLAPFADKVRFVKGDSGEVLAAMAEVEAEAFDIVYLDGDHHREGALTDSRLAWPLAKIGATVIWDDARLPGVRDAVESFLAEISDRFSVLMGFGNRQVWVRKLA